MHSDPPYLTREQLDLTQSVSAPQRMKAIRSASEAQQKLAAFIGTSGNDTTFISLGENCSSAWYLKQLGLKHASYPFDWVFSSPDIVLDCITDRFEAYLDKQLIYAKADGKSAGHSRYHANFFNHINPLSGKDDYDYLKRCCDRFMACAESTHPICYLITLINEPQKRPAWADGFTHEFALPRKQNLNTVSELVKYLSSQNPNAKFVVVDHYTGYDNDANASQINPQTISLAFYAHGKSTGVFFPNPLDDFCFKLMLSGLFGTV